MDVKKQQDFCFAMKEVNGEKEAVNSTSAHAGPMGKRLPGPGAREPGEGGAPARSAARFVAGLVARYGDVARYENAFGEVCFFNHPEHVQAVVQSGDYRRERLMTMVLGEGLLTSDGDYWRGQRQLMAPHFHERCMPGFAPLIVETTLAAFRRWEERREGEMALDLALEMRRLTLDVIVRALFSIELGQELDEISEAVTTVVEDVGAIAGALFNVRENISPARNTHFQGAMGRLDAFARRAIAERRSAGEMPRDLLSVLLQAKVKSTGLPLNDRQIRDEVLTMLIAGHETTAITMGWALYLLAKNPGVEVKLLAEIERVLGGRNPGHGDLAALDYGRMVVDETMRLNPPVWFMMRRAIVDTEIGGYLIPRQASVLVCPFTTHRHRDFWEAPERFEPERFAPERSVDRHRYAHFPFSGGRHHCIGHGLAMMESQLILSMVLQRWKIIPAAGKEVEPDPAITLRQHSGFFAAIERRPAKSSKQG